MINAELNINGLVINKQNFLEKYDKQALNKLKKKYTIFHHDYITNKYKKINGWVEDKENIYLPRSSANKLLNSKIIDNITYNIPNGIDINIVYKGIPTYNQKIICDYLENNIYNNTTNSCILKALAGCHTKNTKILLYNGGVKNIQDININDIVMGDDSTPRKVLELYNGIGQIYKIEQLTDTYYVNENHILSLSTLKGSIINISVKDYILLPDIIKNNLYGYRKVIEFNTFQIIENPYVFGTEIFKYNEIPINLKYNNIKIRLNLLAGIIDINCIVENNKYKLIHNNNKILTDIKFLCNSLGFIYEYNIKYSYIYGNLELPLLFSNKKLKISNNLLLNNIKITKVGIDNYYGFRLDNNQLYVLYDGCIITHNSGKTYIGCEMIKRLKKKTLIIVPNTYLLEQWVNVLVELFPENKIGQYYTKTKIDGDIIVMIINSACYTKTFKFIEKKEKKKNITLISKNEFLKSIGFIIYDECHMYCTNIFKTIFNVANVKNLLGLSATPDERKDNFHKLITLNLGNIINAEDIENYQKKSYDFKSVVNILRYDAPDEYSNVYINPYTNLIHVPKIIEEIISDPYRNQLIINQIIECYNLKKNIFIFSDRRGHLEVLYNELKQQQIENIFMPEINKEDEKILEEKSSVLYGGSTKQDISTAIDNSLVIFTTYQYSSTGVSIVKMDTLILATPRRSNMKQIIGRIFRLGSDIRKERLIIDILDNKSTLKGQLSDRKKAYEHRNSDIEEYYIDYTDINLNI